MQDLNGTWNCQDTLTYYFTQVDNVLLIKGDKGDLHNVGSGIIDQQTQNVILQWADTPDSSGFGHRGVLLMDASEEGKLVKKAGSPDFGIGNFTR